MRDLKPSAFDTQKNIDALASYAGWLRGEAMTAADKVRLYPNRTYLAAIYRALRAKAGEPVDIVRLTAQLGAESTVGRLFVALKVFEERGLVHSTVNGGRLTAEILETNGKTDITRSPVLAALV